MVLTTVPTLDILVGASRVKRLDCNGHGGCLGAATGMVRSEGRMTFSCRLMSGRKDEPSSDCFKEEATGQLQPAVGQESKGDNCESRILPINVYTHAVSLQD